MKSPFPIQDYQHKILFYFSCALLGIFLFFQSASLFATPAEMNVIDPVQVADAGNQGDSSAYGWGAVNYEFWIGKNDVTVGEYAIFLNAVAQKDPLHLYDARMWSAAWPLIQRSGPDAQGNFSYQASRTTSRYPIIFINYKNAQRYCNWLENGKPSGNEVAGITETGAYDLTSSTTAIAVAKKKASFRLPTNDEYHKVTYYKGGSLNAGFYKYPTQTDTVPTSHSMDPNGAHNVNVGLSSQGTDGRNFLQNVGNTIHLATFSNGTYDDCNRLSIGFYGTHDDGCNVAQWTSTTDSSRSFLLVRGADWDYWDHNTNIWDPFYYTASTSFLIQTPDTADEHVGFRVAGIQQIAAFQTAYTSFIESNKKYQTANHAYLAACQQYLEDNATYVTAEEDYHQADVKSHTSLTKYGPTGPKRDAAVQRWNYVYTTEWPAAQTQYTNALQQYAQAKDQHDQAQLDYTQAYSQYLQTCQDLHHAEDQFDLDCKNYSALIVQYDQTMDQLVAADQDLDQARLWMLSCDVSYAWSVNANGPDSQTTANFKQLDDEAKPPLSQATQKRNDIFSSLQQLQTQIQTADSSPLFTSD